MSLVEVTDDEYTRFLNGDDVNLNDLEVNQIEEGNQDNEAKKGHHRYKESEDIAILKEVIFEKPVGKGAAEKWKKIYQRVKIPVKDYIPIKRRFDLMLKQFKSDNAKSLRGSGTEEEYTEKMQLLTEIASVIQDWNNEVQAPTAKKVVEESQKRAQKIRDAAAEGLGKGDQDEDSTPKAKISRQSTREYIEILKTAEERENTQKETQLAMEQKRIEMAERELAIKEENEKHRREMESKQMAMEQRKLDMEEKRREDDNKRMEKEREERALLFQLLRNQCVAGGNKEKLSEST